MLGTLFKAMIIAALVLVLVGAFGLGIMAVVADAHDVKKIPIPRESSLASIAPMWDYADAYRRPMEFNSYRDINQVMDNVPFKGDGEIHRSAREVVYSGSVPGVSYQVAYMLDRDTFPPAVQLVTIYKFKGSKGKYLWKLYRPVHRGLAPYLLDRLGVRGPS